MTKERFADVASLGIVAVVFAAVVVWFFSLVPGAIDRELAAQDALVKAHLQMIHGGDR